MALQNELKHAETALLNFGSSIQEDRQSLQAIKDISKQLKKVIRGAEKECKHTKNEIKKACKKIKKAKQSRKNEIEQRIVAKIQAREDGHLLQYGEKANGAFTELSNTCKNAQKRFIKANAKEVI